MSELERIVNNFVGSCIPDRHKKELIFALKSEFMKAVGKNDYDPTLTNQPDYPDDYTKGKVFGYNQAKFEIREKIKEM